MLMQQTESTSLIIYKKIAIMCVTIFKQRHAGCLPAKGKTSIGTITKLKAASIPRINIDAPGK